MEFLNEYIVLVVLGICLCVGYILKNVIPTDKVNKFIPAAMGVLGIFLNLWASGWSLTPETILGGLVSGLASTGLHQAFKQFLNKE
jgi:hypothetical protein